MGVLSLGRLGKDQGDRAARNVFPSPVPLYSMFDVGLNFTFSGPLLLGGCFSCAWSALRQRSYAKLKSNNPNSVLSIGSGKLILAI